MKVDPLEIYQAQIEFRLCNDLRPCIVVYPVVSGIGIVSVALISSQPDLFDVNFDFWIETDHPNFPATGLTKRSYVAGEHVYQISVSRLRRRYGRFEDELAREFKDFFGI